jgi:hypothetical protein
MSPGLQIPSEHPALTAEDVLSHGGWHLRYARVLAVASDGDYGFALVDGNGDGAELEAETWIWQEGTWTGAASSGTGALASLQPLHTGGLVGQAYYAYGSVPGRQSITISFDGQLHHVPVSQHGAWAFIKIPANPQSRRFPSL